MRLGNPEIEDDEKGKLFVGGLSWETTQDTLQRYFSHYGEVIDCVVMKNNETGRSRGFGFVTFADLNNVQIVLQSGPHNLDGRTIDPKQCNPRNMQKPKTRGGSYPKVFLGGLPSNITETDLRMFFGRYGKVMEVVIMYDQEKKKSRGFGFLSFEDEASVERVTTEHYIQLNGKQVEIKKAEPRDGSSSHKMNPDGMSQSAGSHWGPGPMQGMMQGPNGQMNAPPMNMMSSPMNMMSGYQGWGNPTPQQQNYGYGNPNPAGYANQGWGHQPTQGPPHAAQWGGGYNAAGQAQTQQYGSYDMYNSSSGPAGAGGSGAPAAASWNSSWLNSGSAGSNEMYSRSGPASSGPMQQPPNAGNTKPSEYQQSYGGYGNYTNDQQSFAPRSYGNMGNDLNQQYQQPPSDEFKRYMNQNIKQLI